MSAGVPAEHLAGEPFVELKKPRRRRGLKHRWAADAIRASELHRVAAEASGRIRGQSQSQVTQAVEPDARSHAAEKVSFGLGIAGNYLGSRGTFCDLWAFCYPSFGLVLTAKMPLTANWSLGVQFGRISPEPILMC